MKFPFLRIACYLLVTLAPAITWALFTPGINALEPIKSDARTMALLRFLLAFAFGIFFIYEYKYMVRVYNAKVRPEPDQMINRLAVMKQRERMTAFRWITLGVLSVCAFPLFEYKPEEHTAWRKACQDNVSRVSKALMQYYKEKGQYPPAYVADSTGKPMHSWRVLILPYLGEDELYSRYNFSEPWDGPHNSLLASKVPDAFLCPVRNPRYKSMLTQWIWRPATATDFSYAILSGPGTAFQKDKAPKNADFVDGVERTLLLVERAGTRGNWLKPSDITCAEFSQLPASRLTMHTAPASVFHACFANGSINGLPSSISAKQRTELAQSGDGLPRKMVAN